MPPRSEADGLKRSPSSPFGMLFVFASFAHGDGRPDAALVTDPGEADSEAGMPLPAEDEDPFDK